ncbi:MAG: Protein archease [Saprospiraceae bacterium]|nr:Protein archease [Saprospiraceae bacterium]
MPNKEYKIRFLPHTADVRVQIEADSQEALFRGGLEAMNRVLKKNGCGKPGVLDITRKIDIRAPDATILLVDFLSEILTATHTGKALFCRVDFFEMSLQYLQATVSGYTIRNFDDDIKAVTYHEAEVVRNEKTGRWSTCIIFDI